MQQTGYLFIFLVITVNLFGVFLEFLNLRNININNLEKIKKIFTVENPTSLIKYQKSKIAIQIVKGVVEILVFFYLFATNIIQSISKEIYKLQTFEFIKAFLLFVSFYVALKVVELPFIIIDTFYIEKFFGFSKITKKLFLKDMCLQTILGAILLFVVLFIIINFICISGPIWWILSSCFLILLSFFILYIYPIFIAPMFNKFTPLTDTELELKIKDILEKTGFSLENVYVMDASKRSTHSNAYFTGFGKKKRLVLFDTFLKNHNHSEIISVLSHELGHFKHNHIIKMFLLNALVIFLAMFVSEKLLQMNFVTNIFGFNNSLYNKIFIIFTIFLPLGNIIFNLIFMPILRLNEYQADEFAIKLTMDPETFKNTLVKLYKDNLSNPVPHPLYVFFNYSHPPLVERIRHIFSFYDKYKANLKKST
ncbi:Ste24 endopeptidase [Thermodesulfobium narugense DSM 14796]|uniref:Ste24 endopeptidase n=1 Tax=Thermodesulfobium narugense DSM 14796 TaxID=747365 RepID=M1E6Z5_9BACT|nr:M48 family metallopeptidase [Thermodesulfobium narugense]AEE15056.1 Ste24 endopeptidase [Thermodesulfobium narugense DSM 14796]